MELLQEGPALLFKKLEPALVLKYPIVALPVVEVHPLQLLLFALPIQGHIVDPNTAAREVPLQVELELPD